MAGLATVSTHGFRYWGTPDAPPEPQEPRRSRATILSIVASLLAVAVSLGLLLALIVSRGHYRDEEQRQSQQQINQTFCRVLAELPAANADLNRIRGQLGCAEPGVQKEVVP